ncbi:MAG: response regulator transcription factor [Ignavibacteria bacterium]|nr:response regulator transcription factor [Ignavibacteria bacterium]MBT8380744.1 response regulator transcription factor [Ignavibacteria bacterium]MBT8392425.1 response regulator transcription factor [Ignavibacteria bacterium]NNJ54074.1 response regulator transcription factor [Ignavibacteriaceae bacterium]NNL22668.1 response regulator transcription factor [Ignavibacteriaceae bacterium]
MKKILIIEDEPATVAGLEEALKEEYFEVSSALTGEHGYKKAKDGDYNLIILDLKLPDMSGIDICKNLRKDEIQIPILMLTAKKQEMDKVLGLEIGADYYMTKPFSIKELIAVVRRLLKRPPTMITEIDEFSFGNVFINFKNKDATKNGKQVELTAMEFEVMKYFIQHESEVIDRDSLLDDVWGYENYPSTRTVDNFILSLRKKIEDDYKNPKHILTKHGAGYKFVK